MPAPQLVVLPSAAKRLRHHGCWVFRDELLALPPAIPNGTVVELTDRHGAFLAYAFFNVRSHIAARAVSARREDPVTRALFKMRLAQALAKRDGLAGTTAKRLVFSEADGLPGLIVDQYAEHLVLQIRTAGLEPWRATLVDLLRRSLRPKGILERSDQEFREEEGLAPVTQTLLGEVPPRLVIEEDGLRFSVDPHGGQKTGFYLDQRDTRRFVRGAVAREARVLDAFAYTGAFGIGAASRGADVICLERHEPFLGVAAESAALNGLASRIRFVAGDAFYWLEAQGGRPDRFDWILLDPPALAKTKADVPRARQALQRLIGHALGALAKEGKLVLSVCTYHLLGLAEEVLRMAAEERGLRLRMLALTLQATDHPWILQIPATRYLMTWTAQCDG